MRRALSDREVQPFDKGRVQFRGVLGISKDLLQSPVGTDYGPSLDLHNTIVPTRFDDLPVETRRSKDTADDLRIKVNPSVVIRGTRSRFIRLEMSRKRVSVFR